MVTFKEYKIKTNSTKDLNKFGKMINDDGFLDNKLLFSILQNLEEEILSLKEGLEWEKEELKSVKEELREIQSKLDYDYR